MVSVRNLLRKLLGRPPARARRSPTGRAGLGLRAGLTVPGLFAELHRRGASYVVLRWFEGLPHGDPDGDIDLLIADRDVAAIADLFEHNPKAIQVDLFSVSGLPGTTYYEMPYLPPAKAAEVLRQAVLFEDTCMVPGPEVHFLSLAYHTIYQKGQRSGLATSAPGVTSNPAPKHDYAGTLDTLAKAAGIEVAITLEALDDYLGQRGWRPAPEILTNLAEHNKWLAAHLGQTATHK